MSKENVLQRDENDILFDVTYQLLEETFEPIVQHINSNEFKEQLKNRLVENGVIIEFKDNSSVDEFGLPKYLIVSDTTIEHIQEDIGLLKLDK